MSENNAELHRLAVGALAQGIVAEVLGDPSSSVSPLKITRAAATVLARRPISYRPQESLLDAVTAAGVYLRRFCPTDSWTFVGAEYTSHACKFDLVWEHPDHGVLIDELKLGIGRGGEIATRAQIDRYLAEGALLWSEFVGVRLCAVHEPGRSRLYEPRSSRSALVSEVDLARELAAR